MRLRDIQRQKTWLNQVKFNVESISEPQETQYGFCQVAMVTDTMGQSEPINMFYEDPQFEVDQDKLGEQWFKVKWIAKDGYFKGHFVDPPKDVQVSDSPNWEKINLGKCRTVVLCAVLQSGKYNVCDIAENTNMQNSINKLAEFCMKGQL